jgi:arylsulfatase A-like enzyme
MKRRNFLGTIGAAFAAGSVKAAVGRPNILLILSDDMGYSDIGCFGGDADTPVLDGMAKNGIRFSQFYNGARCMPTRASLLTGLYAHQAGIGHMAGKWGVPAYTGHLIDGCVTIGQVLQTAGYHTSQLGKWHVGGEKTGVTPWTHGFDRSWVREGKVHYFKHDIYKLDGKDWTCPDPDHFYSTEEMDRQAVTFIEDARKQGKPFFMYAAYDAAHWPLHAKPEDIAKYRGRFKSKGWTNMRKERYERLVRFGLIDEKWPMSPRDPAVPAWNEVDDHDLWDLKMAIYCAQIDSLDRSIGRILKRIKELGMADNTLVMFLQDNGACPEGIGSGGPNSKIEPGPAESFMAYHMPWANVSNTPFKLYKHFTGEGGISTPLVAYWPKGISNPGRISHEVGHIIDIMATCVDVSGAEYPKKYKGSNIKPMEGLSLDPVFKTGTRKGHELLFWEHEGNRAVRKGKWKLMSRYENDTEYYKSWGYPKKPRKQEWELYDMENDRTEMTELSAKHPEIAKELVAEYQKWADRVGALPFDEVRKD